MQKQFLAVTILVSSKEIANPGAVRFCFDDMSMPDVFSSEGLPLAPFRTDNWYEFLII